MRHRRRDRWSVSPTRLLNMAAAIPQRLHRLGTVVKAATPANVIVATAIGGFSGVGAMAVLVYSAQHVDQPLSVLPWALLFLPLLFVYRWARRTMMEMSLIAVQASLYRARSRIARKIAALDLRDRETVASETVVGALSQAYDTISESAMAALIALQSTVLLVLGFAYLAYLSPVALIFAVVTWGIMARNYLADRAALQDAMTQTAAAETTLLGTLNEFLSGFKELRLHREKRQAVLAELRSGSMLAARRRAKAAGIFTVMLTDATSCEYFVGAAVVFLLPILTTLHGAELPAILSAVLFLLGPFGGVAGSIPQITALWFAVERLRMFEQRVDDLLAAAIGTAHVPAAVEAITVPELREIELRSITYEHRTTDRAQGFRVGPLEFKIQSKEIVFITGRNGAGKTTGLRLITGLYPPRTGQILLNGIPLNMAHIEAYRQLFAPVFADFHIFRKPYALNDAQLQTLQELLHWLQIADKLPSDLRAGYDPTALSTGERKRLALALAVAEDRPILVFDEWAADQDPEFRRAFYETMLPTLRDTGKAIIAITHDDRYFGVADRRYHMEDRRMAFVSVPS
jgi:putative pyoverdin transport system ATP-binding/permease protein